MEKAPDFKNPEQPVFPGVIFKLDDKNILLDKEVVTQTSFLGHFAYLGISNWNSLHLFPSLNFSFKL